MNQATFTAAAESSRAVATPTPARTPRCQRIGSAIASVLVSGVLFGSVVLGMTAMGGEGQRVIVESPAATRA